MQKHSLVLRSNGFAVPLRISGPWISRRWLDFLFHFFFFFFFVFFFFFLGSPLPVFAVDGAWHQTFLMVCQCGSQVRIPKNLGPSTKQVMDGTKSLSSELAFDHSRLCQSNALSGDLSLAHL